MHALGLGDKVHSVNCRRKEERYKHEEKLLVNGVLSDQEHNAFNSDYKQQNDIKNSAKISVYQTVLAVKNFTLEHRVQTQKTLEKRLVHYSKIVLSIPAEALTSNGKDNKSYSEVYAKRDNQKHEAPQAIEDERLWGYFTRNKLLYKIDEQKSRGNGNKALIYAERKTEQRNRDYIVEHPSFWNKVSRKDGEQKCQRIDICKEHIRKRGRKRRKWNNQSRERSLNNLAFDVKHLYNHTDSERYEYHGKNAVNPRHWKIGENHRQNAKSPSSRLKTYALVKHHKRVVVVRKLICKNKYVRQ